MKPSKAEFLKQAIIDRIRLGSYPVGSKLPGLRSAATEFGVHATTVARVYSELADLGIVRMVQGSGTFVLAIPDTRNDRRAIDELFRALCAHAVHSRRLGLTRRDWAQLVAEAEAAAYDSDGPTMWFVECSPRDTSDLASSLSALLERPIRPMLVDDVSHHLLARAPGEDFFITTPFHVEEMEKIVGDGTPVVTVNVVPTSDTLVKFARIPSSAKISVIASNTQTLERFITMIRTYVRRDPVAAVCIDAPMAAEVVRNAEVLIDSQSIHDRILEWEPRGEVLTVRYQIESTSLAFLREILRRRGISKEAEISCV